MEKYIKRETYLRQLIDRMDNGEVKIVTGPRRSGKSWLLNRIFKDYLLEQGVAEENIIIVSFDLDDEEETGDLTDRQTLKSYLYSRITDAASPYYIMLDEVQEVDGFEKIVNGLNAKDNVDVYITGSNSHFLSSDIKTIFRGRGDEVRVWPFSFREFCSERTEPVSELWGYGPSHSGNSVAKGQNLSANCGKNTTHTEECQVFYGSGLQSRRWPICSVCGIKPISTMS